MPDITARLADGTTLSFPDGTPDAVVEKTVREQVQLAKVKAVQAKKYPSAQEQTPDTRTTGQVAWDQTKEVGKGAIGLIPGMYNAAKGVLVGAGKISAGQYREGGNQISDAAAGLLHGAVAPVEALGTVARGVGAYAAPESVNAPSRQDWESAAQTGGAMAAGAGVEAVVKGFQGTDATRIKELANKAREYRTANPIGQNLRGVDITKPLDAAARIAQTAPTIGATVAAPALDQLARLKNAMATPIETRPFGDNTPLPEQTGYKLEGALPEINAPGLPQASPERVAMPQEVVGVSPDPYMTKNIQGPPIAPQVEQPPIGVEPPVSRDAMGQPVEPQLEALRQVETPEQLYARQQQVRNTEFQPDPMQQQPPIGAQYPPPQPIPQGPAPMNMDYPIQQLPPEVTGVMDALFEKGKPVTLANSDLAARNAPYLLEAIPELKNVPAGPGFDARLFNGFQRIGHELNTTEASIPRETPVPTANAVKQLTAIEQEALNANQPGAVRAIAKAKDFLAERPTMTWEQFIKMKRSFFDEVKLNSRSGKAVYETFKEMSKAVSTELSELNQKWFTAKTATELANMNPRNGLRLAAEQKGRLDAAKKARGTK